MFQTLTKNKRWIAVCATIVVYVALAGGSALVSLFPPHAASSSGTKLTGYVWSDTIGWISMSGSNYGIILGGDDTLSGYGWSENIGWVSANSSDLSGCPSGSCVAKIINGQLQGWLRALSNGGGWDGWISLRGSNYGPTADNAGNMSGYAWGSDVVGWLDFSYAYVDYAPCTFNGQTIQSGGTVLAYATTSVAYGSSCPSEVRTCTNGSLSGSYQYSSCEVLAKPPTGTISADPKIVQYGSTSTVTWSSTDATSCTVTGNNDSWTGTSGSQTTSPLVGATTYTLECENQGVYMDPVTTTIRIVPRLQET